MAIPDIPTWVKEEMAKLDYQRREAFKVTSGSSKKPFKVSLINLMMLQHCSWFFLEIND